MTEKPKGRVGHFSMALSQGQGHSLALHLRPEGEGGKELDETAPFSSGRQPMGLQLFGEGVPTQRIALVLWTGPTRKERRSQPGVF